MTEFIKLTGIALLISLTAVFLRQYRPEYALITTLSAAVLTAFAVLPEVASSIASVGSMYESSGADFSLFTVSVKAVGIGYLTEFAADIAKESSLLSLSSAIIFAGKCIILILCIPLTEKLLSAALSLL